jgi:hypothetical protein
MGKATSYRGLQSTRSQGGLRPNLRLNRLEIAILEKGFDRDRNIPNRKIQSGWGSDPGGLTRWLGWSNCHGDQGQHVGPPGLSTGQRWAGYDGPVDRCFLCKAIEKNREIFLSPK